MANRRNSAGRTPRTCSWRGRHGAHPTPLFIYAARVSVDADSKINIFAHSAGPARAGDMAATFSRNAIRAWRLETIRNQGWRAAISPASGILSRCNVTRTHGVTISPHYRATHAHFTVCTANLWQNQDEHKCWASLSRSLAGSKACSLGRHGSVAGARAPGVSRSPNQRGGIGGDLKAENIRTGRSRNITRVRWAEGAAKAGEGKAVTAATSGRQATSNTGHLPATTYASPLLSPTCDVSPCALT